MAAIVEKVGIDPNEVAKHVKDDWPRSAVCGVVFFIELWFVVSYARHHYEYGSVGGLYFFLKLLIILTIFEVLRWSDFLVHHYFTKGRSTGRRPGHLRARLE